MIKDKVGVGLIGLGTVGSGVYRILTLHREDYKAKTGIDIEVKAVYNRTKEKLDRAGVDAGLYMDLEKLIADPKIDIVVEVIGGIEPAKSIMTAAFAAGKSVVTANKELMSRFGGDLLEAAKAAGVDLFYEASVGGGIPIIHPLKESLASNKIAKVMGIVNGTTNFILTQMTEKGYSFKEALKEAQERGYAETDPSADIEGRDAAAKIAILASIAFNSRVTAADVSTEGISKITSSDIEYASEMGYAIKLMAVAKEEEEGLLEVGVYPAMIPKSHPLASVSGVYNAIFVEGDSVGEVMFFGQGAGSLPAASAVVSDIIAIARNIKFGATGRFGCGCFMKLKMKPAEAMRSRYYLRLRALDKPGVLARISQVFGDYSVSLASVIQKDSGDESAADLVFITHKVVEGDFRRALNEISSLDVVDHIHNVIRVEDSKDG